MITELKPLCDSGCGSEIEYLPLEYLYYCPECGEHSGVMQVHEFNSTEKQVWLRSKRVSYSAVLKKTLLLPDGTVRGMPEFKWERWP